jgi:predicted nuclease with TOPRIM domain
MKLSELLLHASKLVEEQEELIKQHEAHIQYQDDRIETLEKDNCELRGQVNYLQDIEHDLEKRLNEVGSLFQNVANILTNNTNL